MLAENKKVSTKKSEKKKNTTKKKKTKKKKQATPLKRRLIKKLKTIQCILFFSRVIIYRAKKNEILALKNYKQSEDIYQAKFSIIDFVA